MLVSRKIVEKKNAIRMRAKPQSVTIPIATVESMSKSTGPEAMPGGFMAEPPAYLLYYLGIFLHVSMLLFPHNEMN